MLAPSGDRLIYERVINGTVCARHTHIFSFGSVYLAKNQRSGPQPWYGSPIHDRMVLPFSNNRSRFTLGSVLISCACMRCATHHHENGFRVYTGPRVYSYNSVLFVRYSPPTSSSVHGLNGLTSRFTDVGIDASFYVFEAEEEYRIGGNTRKDKRRTVNCNWRYTSRRNTRKVRKIFLYPQDVSTRYTTRIKHG